MEIIALSGVAYKLQHLIDSVPIGALFVAVPMAMAGLAAAAAVIALRVERWLSPVTKSDLFEPKQH